MVKASHWEMNLLTHFLARFLAITNDEYFWSISLSQILQMAGKDMPLESFCVLKTLMTYPWRCVLAQSSNWNMCPDKKSFSNGTPAPVTLRSISSLVFWLCHKGYLLYCTWINAISSDNRWWVEEGPKERGTPSEDAKEADEAWAVPTAGICWVWWFVLCVSMVPPHSHSGPWVGDFWWWENWSTKSVSDLSTLASATLELALNSSRQSATCCPYSL